MWITGVAGAALGLTAGLVGLLGIALMFLVVMLLQRLVFGRSISAQQLLEQRQMATGAQLEVNRGWALAAAGADVVFDLVSLAWVVIVALNHGAFPGGSVVAGLAVALYLGLIAFTQRAHHAATYWVTPAPAAEPSDVRI